MAKANKILNPRNWKYAVGELLLIVAGITIALAANEWRENSSEKSLEREILEGLYLDFEATLASVDDILIKSDIKIEKILILQSLTGPNSEAIDSDEFILYFDAWVNAPGDFAASEATLMSLLNSQGLAVISSYDLRLKLADWPRLREKILRQEERVLNLWFEESGPYVWERFPMVTLDALNNSALTPSKFEFNQIELLQDIQFENIINETYYSYNNTRRALLEAKTALLGLIENIQTELSKFD